MDHSPTTFNHLVTQPTKSTVAQDTVPPSPTTKRFRTSAERKAELQADPWLDPTKVTAKKVRCLGCGNDVKLDMREGSDYYPARWNKHKKSCRYVQEGRRKADGDQEQESGHFMATTPYDETTPGSRTPVSKPSAAAPIGFPVGWTASSLKGGGSTIKSTADLLREIGREGPLIWGSRPSTPASSAPGTE
ncbi:hypothetical protein E1B28_002876 [Marasmius oreades]|uniref:Uncharacterized protein n=1 Tax=Marasmius oreades TaxID=181124 RepID=A0A9P7UPD9_9AGAR|nr:uncharacterized protein E1B28_002876 [Marasmius oreades]KAG7086959.1 hypothetical protein E1B28_002876 [Marasmius oreades]